MANFNFTVETGPMANAIDGVKHHVDGVGIAVGAMGTAVASAEKKAADHICANVDRGFYSLIRSQLSQKTAKLRSEVMARLMEMHETSKALTFLKSQMQRDYNMIAQRYNKLFTSINSSLRARIFELEKAPVSLAATELPILDSRIRRIAATTLLYEEETIQTIQMLGAAKLKSNTARAIGATKTSVQNSLDLDKQVHSIVDNMKVEASTILQMPIIVIESDDIITGRSSFRWEIPAHTHSIDGKSTFADVERQMCEGSDSLEWDTVSNNSRENIVQSVQRIISKSAISERVSKQMVSLLESNSWTMPTGVVL